ncbi:MAG: 1-deoxy-D-xylulose-5-phosphate synthase [Clostridiales bacterium]|nr:1-deoxy-D-xylulose-5-phosphate synthase [Clostridiales bacterium]
MEYVRGSYQVVSILDKINNVEDLRKLNLQEKEQLADEIRQLVIDVVSKNGGHLASNLGVVELTIAIHSIFNTPNDSVVWDVGHQTYIHKILTGRKDSINTIRKFNGISGFPRICESNYDCFGTGHSSTSISAAIGIARANKLQKKDNKTIAVIGDGALTGGMAQEALNDAGASDLDLVVILNDNEMSISKNVGGITFFLSKLRSKKFYTKTNNKIKEIVYKVPIIGKSLVYHCRKIKKHCKQLFIKKMYYEDIGFTYLGPVNGHNLEKMESILELSKNIKGPVLIHVVTKKGKGYKFAEENPNKFHGISAFDKETGLEKKAKKKDYSAVFGEKLVEMAKKDRRIVAVSAAMIGGTGLGEFKKEFPDRIFDVGIAEQHALCMAAGLAKSGLKPVVSIYSSFYQRAYDQVIHDICIQNLPVVMCVDRAGIVGNDGETHQGIFDIAFFSMVPNITIMAPKDFNELKQMLQFALKLNTPVVIRYSRGSEGIIKFKENSEIHLGQAELIKEGNDLTIIAIGKMVERAYQISEILQKKNIKCEVINARFVKPLDYNILQKSINKTKKVITIEDGILHGGLGSGVLEMINECKIENVYLKSYGYRDCFVEHGSVQELERKYGLDVDSIITDIEMSKIIKC